MIAGRKPQARVPVDERADLAAIETSAISAAARPAPTAGMDRDTITLEQLMML